MVKIEITKIKDKIYTIRGVQMILDRDLGGLYDLKPFRLREQVKRNIERFPKDFMFQLNEEEIDYMVSQNAIPSKKHLGGYLPYAFTEQGVAMLSSVLKNKKAVEINIKIIRAFVAMRHFLIKNANIFNKFRQIDQKLLKHDKSLERIFQAIENKNIKPKQGIFFDGQIFDAYKFVSDLIRNAKKSIVLIDNFVDDSVLTLFSKSCVETTIFTKNISKQLKLDLEKYNLQYKPITIKEFKNSHDRFMIIDNKQVYHIGASLKDLGKKWFAFSRFDKEALIILEKLG